LYVVVANCPSLTEEQILFSQEIKVNATFQLGMP